MPCRHECRDGSEEVHTEACHDTEDRTIEYLPKANAEDGTDEAEFIQLRPARYSISHGQCHYYPRPECDHENLTVHGILNVHAGEDDGIESCPDDPRCLRWFCLAPKDGKNVREESDDRQYTRSDRKKLLEIHGGTPLFLVLFPPEWCGLLL